MKTELTKCIVCYENEAIAWFNTKSVCNKCYIKLKSATEISTKARQRLNRI